MTPEIDASRVRARWYERSGYRAALIAFVAAGAVTNIAIHAGMEVAWLAAAVGGGVYVLVRVFDNTTGPA